MVLGQGAISTTHTQHGHWRPEVSDKMKGDYLWPGGVMLCPTVCTPSLGWLLGQLSLETYNPLQVPVFLAKCEDQGL